MYRYRYNYPRSFSFANRYDRNRYYRYSRRYPWYSNDRWRPRASDRYRRDRDRDDDRRRQPTYPHRRPNEEPEDPKPEVPRVDLEKELHVKSVDLQIERNTDRHHTDEYECTMENRTRRTPEGKRMPPELVVRRGQEWEMTIEFDRPYDIKRNDITLVFNMGDDYKPNKDLNAVFKINEEGAEPYKPRKWGARLIKKSGNKLTIGVFMPASVPIGEWEFSMRTTVGVENGKDKIWQYNHNEDINVLFNPWCKEDNVYMEDEAWRREAVLNDDGVQYKGNFNRMSAKTWFYGQFEDGVLDAAFYLLLQAFGERAAPGMGNASVVSRLISKMVNSQDDRGVMVGNWSGEYGDGIRPTRWSGSDKILLKFMENYEPVKYGQCWVFSAVTTTVCRALGLPCRSVTNFSSAHNTDQNHLSIDYHYVQGPDGDYIRSEDDADSIWNFHVWNEVWTARPDLDENGRWDGWQVIDATPQEKSDGVFQCGPAPVKAIKEGEISVGFDGPFIFSEVNADKVEFKEDPITGMFLEKKRKKAVVGKATSTHLPTGRSYKGSTLGNQYSKNMERLDLTNDYKYEEGTEKEREAVRKAQKKFSLMNSGSSLNDDFFNDYWGFTDSLEIEFEDPGDVFIGSDFRYVVHVKNTSEERVHVNQVVLKCFYKTYYDSYRGLAKMDKSVESGGLWLQPGEVHTAILPIEPEVSLAKPKDGYIFELQAVAHYQRPDGYEDTVTDEYEYRLRRPDIRVEGPKSCSSRDRIQVEVSFTNPFNIYLTNCDIDLDGGFIFVDPRADSFPINDLGPSETWKRTLTLQPKLHPRKKKEREFSIGFDSRQLGDISGYYCVELK